MIELKDVSKHWNHPLFERVNLKIPKGDFLYIVGESGSGKSTLLKLILGEERPTRGTVEIFGKKINQISHSDLQNIRQRIGVIFQDLRLVDDLNIRDNVNLSLELLDSKGRKNINQSKRILEDVLTALNLLKIADKKVRTLSGGERQKVAIARAIVRHPEILIADEPTAGLDRDQSLQIMDIIQKLNLRGTTVLIATHDREMVRRFRHRSCLLKAGRVQAEEGISLL